MPTDQELIKIVPSSRQLAYQATEFYAFFHFGDIPAIALSPVHRKMEGEMWSGKCLKHAVVMG